MMILEQVGRLQLVVIDHIVVAYQREYRLVREILSLALHRLMGRGQQLDRLTTATASG